MTQILVISHDYETTGLDTEKDGVVQSCIILTRIFKNGVAESLSTRTDLWNPGKLIPEPATAVHGITDDMVADKPDYVAGLTAIYKSLLNAEFRIGPVVATMGYNNRDYDDRIANRLGLPKDFPVIDLFPWGKQVKKNHKLPNAKLTTIYKHFTGRELEGAHDASADVNACLEILPAIMDEFGFDDIRAFLEACNTKNIDPEMAMPYGKHKGKTLRALYETEKGYVSWLLSNTYNHNRDVVDTLMALKEGKI